MTAPIPIRSEQSQPAGTALQAPEAEPFFELRFAELRVTLQRPPYRLFGALVTGASLISVWLAR
ncbi:hypothetical protein OG410_41460 [Streptomyces sp. NBC_00659]|uniref:hypothetical protein n=1 Tax=Streptomyces sp. NBC_00659 TaxID=2903669 RepID=UPI002E3169DA|nr:hypothetical protein [Streptomyces sp. NBC_00659]